MCENVTYTLTEEELYTAIRRTRRRAGTVRLVVQSVLLAGLSVVFAVDFARHTGGGSLFLAIVMAILAVGQWVFPALAFRREAKALAAEGVSIRLSVTDESLTVGDGVTQPLSACVLEFASETLLLWRVDRSQAVAIPRRVVSDAVWECLSAHID